MHSPGKIFKGLHRVFFEPRMASLLRNDVALYPTIRVLNRLSKDGLAGAVKSVLPQMASLLEKGRLNVAALISACDGDAKHLVPRLCFLGNDPVSNGSSIGGDLSGQMPDQSTANTKPALVSHGSQIVNTLLAIPTPPSPAKAIQASLVSLTPQQMLCLATKPSTSRILVHALSPSTSAHVSFFHKLLVSALLPHVMALAVERPGLAILETVLATPSQRRGTADRKDVRDNRGNNRNSLAPGTSTSAVVPFYLKENAMQTFANNEATLRESYLGRQLWRAWKGDIWLRSRRDWTRWVREAGGPESMTAGMPTPRREEGFAQTGRMVQPPGMA